MKKPIFYFLFLICLGLTLSAAEWILADKYYPAGKTWDDLSDNERLTAMRQAGFEAKYKAFSEGRPLLVCVGNKTCANCANAWNRVLGTGEFASFADSRNLVLLEIYNIENIDDFNFLYYSAAKGDPVEENTPGTLPFFGLFWIKSSFEENAIFDRTNSTILGLWSCNDGHGNLTMDWMTERIDKYLTSDPTPVLNFVTGQADLPTATTGGVEYYQNSAWNASTAASLNYAREIKFKFQGLKGRRHFFALTGFTARDDFQLTLSIYDAAGQNCLKTASGQGFDILDKGFYFDPADDGLYRLVISRDGEENATGFDFTLRNHIGDPQTDDNLGSICNPLWTGFEKGKWTMDLESVLDSGQPFLIYFTGLCWCPYCIALDNMAFQTELFKNTVKDFPLVTIDNRRRGEITGTSLLYTEGYQNTIREAVPGITEAELSDLIENKLAENQLIQKANLAPGGTRIGYPTLIICRPGSPDGRKLNMVGRASNFTTYPVGQDFSKIAADYVQAQITLLNAEDDEEDNNYLEYCHSLGEIPAGEVTTHDAYLGSCDLTDYLAFTLGGKADFSITAAFQGEQLVDTATFTLELFDSENNRLTSGQGTVAEPPVLEYRGNAGETLKIKLNVASAQTRLAPYTLILDGTQDFPPYDIAIPESLYFARVCDSQFTIPVAWSRCEDTEEPLVFTVTCEKPDDYLQDTSVTVTIPAATGTSGTADAVFNVTPAPNSRTTRAYRMRLDFQAGTARLAGLNQTIARLVFAPQFLQLANNGTTNLSLVQDLSIGNIRYAFINGASAVTYKLTNGSLPSGLAVSLSEPDENHIQYLEFTGTPRTASPASVTISLYGDSVLGHKHTFNFSIQEIRTVNPNAAVNLFGGSIIRNGGLADTFTLSLDASRHLTLTTGNGDVYTANGWSLDNSGNLVATLTDSQGNAISLLMPPDGKGSGRLDASQGLAEATVSFAPAADFRQYAGQYNAMLQAENDFSAYGFAQFTVSPQSAVSFQATLPDGSTVTASSVLVTDGDIASFTVTAPAMRGEYADGLLNSVIAIIPQADRIEGETCVSASATWQRTETSDELALSLLGNQFDPQSKFYIQTAEDPDSPANLFHLTAGCDNSGNPVISQQDAIAALLPVGLEFSESGSNSFSFVRDYYEEINPVLSYDASTGRLTGSFNVISPDDFTSRKATLQGVLIPVPGCSDCSGQAIIVGAGQFFLEGEIALAYPFEIILGGYQHSKNLAMPAFAADSQPQFPDQTFAIDGETTLNFSCGNSQDTLLFFRQGELLPVNQQQRSLTVSPDDLGEYAVRAARLGRLSQPLIFNLSGPADSLAVFPDSAEPGWYLLALPAGLTLDEPQASNFLKQFRPLQYDTAAGTFAEATEFKASHAYFVFLPTESAGMQNTLTFSYRPVVPAESACEFLLINLQEISGQDSWLWNNSQYLKTTDAMAGLSALTGAWISNDK